MLKDKKAKKDTKEPKPVEGEKKALTAKVDKLPDGVKLVNFYSGDKRLAGGFAKAKAEALVALGLDGIREVADQEPREPRAAAATRKVKSSEEE